MEIPLLQCTVEVSRYEEILSSSVNSLGFTKLTDDQHKAITAFLSGRDVFVSLPTGSGKSLCFALVPKVVELLKIALNIESPHRSVMFVVSPLVSLMQDQVTRFRALGLPSVVLSRFGELEEVQSIKHGEYRLVFMSPETLGLQLFRELLCEDSVLKALVGIAVDEAHCINDWGFDFRKDFANIGRIRSLATGIQVMALTATAMFSTRRLILKSLEMSNCHMITKLPKQLNITYQVVTTNATGISILVAPLLEELRSSGAGTDKTIVYCRSYRDIVDIYRALILGLGDELVVTQSPEQKGRLVEKYDACTESGLKSKIVNSFVKPDSILRVVVATTAFGMGIDSPNVRRVIHWGPPESIAMYVQQVGRCGRDKGQSKAILYIGQDTRLNTADDQMLEYCKRVDKCRRIMLLEPFQEPRLSNIARPHFDHLCCDVCHHQCQCGTCKTTETQPQPIPDCESTCTHACLSSDNIKSLHAQLVDFHLLKLTVNGHYHMASRLSTVELISGISDASIDIIVSHHNTIFTYRDILGLVPSLSKSDGIAISDIIDQFYL